MNTLGTGTDSGSAVEVTNVDSNRYGTFVDSGTTDFSLRVGNSDSVEQHILISSSDETYDIELGSVVEQWLNDQTHIPTCASKLCQAVKGSRIFDGWSWLLFFFTLSASIDLVLFRRYVFPLPTMLYLFF